MVRPGQVFLAGFFLLLHVHVQCLSVTRSIRVSGRGITPRQVSPRLLATTADDADGGGPLAKMKKYGAKYFLVWFSIYLPFLLTFFWGIENDVLNTAKYGIDPPSALNSLCDKVEELTHNGGLMAGIRGSTHAANFAAAYLCADLVPTTVMAVGVLAYLGKNDEKKDAAAAAAAAAAAQVPPPPVDGL